ncbi:MAG: flippase-like domain-containing protein, partial [Bacteroidaceae bacterium]|nr:flippase-like domain-containing protein [Bacteroidaceae bacterium]
ERLIDTLVVVTMTTIAVALQWNVFIEFINEVGIATPGDNIGGWIIIILSATAIAAMLYIFLRKMSIWKKIRSFISRFSDGLLSITKMKNGWLFILETLAIWFCYFMQFYLCFFYFPFTENLSFLAGLLLFVAGSIAVVVPTPNGAGPWHFAVISIMTLYGVSETDASVFALIVHSTQTLIVAILGIYALIMLQFKKRLNKN